MISMLENPSVSMSCEIHVEYVHEVSHDVDNFASMYKYIHLVLGNFGLMIGPLLQARGPLGLA